MTRTPAAPFTTSTLQQEASRKLGFSAQRTMAVAQRLYESGMITYMRTDSVNLSDQALRGMQEAIAAEFGGEYHQLRRYRTKSKGAQEAHEAIRPTDAARQQVDGDRDDARLYDLIRKRALASQMADAQLKRTTAEISPEGLSHRFVAHGEVVTFDGFLRLYAEGHDEDRQEEGDDRLPRLAVGQAVDLHTMVAQERYTQRPPRYSEASLVKRLEELGIGRPSTYAPTIATIVDRGYVERDSREGETRQVWQMELKGGALQERVVSEKYGADRKKLFPSDIAMVVTDYLLSHFPRMMEYTFTASVEEQFDSIAEGRLDWRAMLSDFYGPFHSRVESALSEEVHVSGDRLLGEDPASGKPVLVRIGRYGPLAQIGHSDGEEKPRYASLRKGQLLETITLEEALLLFALPRDLGEYEGEAVTVGTGRFGPYVRHAGKFASLGKSDDPYQIDLARAIELIEAKRRSDAERQLRVFAEDARLQVLKGRWGPYLSLDGKAYRLPKGADWESMSHAEALRIISEQQAASPAKKGAARRAKGESSSAKGAVKAAKPRAKGRGKAGGGQ